MNRTKCPRCGCHYNDIEFEDFCVPRDSSFYAMASAVLMDDMTFEVRDCASCGGPVMLVRNLKEEQGQCLNN